MSKEKALFGAGCFWGVQAAFDEVNGVVKTAVGYAGGTTENPSYEQVCSNSTGHAEVVLVEFDSKKVSYEKLLKRFFEIHDPAQLNRQGPDVGSQYRSAIFFFSKKQEKASIIAKQEWEEENGAKAVTQVLPAPAVYPAEEYHQKYLKKNKRAIC